MGDMNIMKKFVDMIDTEIKNNGFVKIIMTYGHEDFMCNSIYEITAYDYTADGLDLYGNNNTHFYIAKDTESTFFKDIPTDTFEFCCRGINLVANICD